LAASLSRMLAIVFRFFAQPHVLWAVSTVCPDSVVKPGDSAAELSHYRR